MRYENMNFATAVKIALVLSVSGLLPAASPSWANPNRPPFLIPETNPPPYLRQEKLTITPSPTTESKPAPRPCQEELTITPSPTTESKSTPYLCDEDVSADIPLYCPDAAAIYSYLDIEYAVGKAVGIDRNYGTLALFVSSCLLNNKIVSH